MRAAGQRIPRVIMRAALLKLALGMFIAAIVVLGALAVSARLNAHTGITGPRISRESTSPSPESASIPETSASSPPPIPDKAATARWIVANARYGFIAALNGTRPFVNVISTANATIDGTKHGSPIFYTSMLDATDKMLRKNPYVSLGFSEAEMGLCSSNDTLPDPEDPLCARLTLSGNWRNVTGHDYDVAKEQLFRAHPEMKSWPSDHGWLVNYLDIEEVWIIDVFGGADILSAEEYYSATPLRA